MAAENGCLNVYLCGFMAAGKTTVGRILSEKLGRPFLDTDEEAGRRQGLTAADIISGKGLFFFRELESRILKEMPRSGLVVALGGGIYPEGEREDIFCRRGFCVFLSAGLETLLKRAAGQAKTRPLLYAAGELYAERLPFYRRASVTVETDRLSAEETAAAVLDLLKKRDLI